jgi:hypothetical protein
MSLFRNFLGLSRREVSTTVFIAALHFGNCNAQYSSSSGENRSFEMPDDNFLNNPSGQKFHDWRNLPLGLGTASTLGDATKDGGLPVGE